ncbi:CTP synthase, partial [Escherichia coli]|nr:CTP synthase [Escherichia coli]
GLYPSKIKENTLAHQIYDAINIEERHRHRYEFNNEFREQLEANGMVFSGTSPDGRLVEMVEIPENDFYIACQFHPEFLSRPNRPQPIFKSFVEA